MNGRESAKQRHSRRRLCNTLPGHASRDLDHVLRSTAPYRAGVRGVATGPYGGIIPRLQRAQQPNGPTAPFPAALWSALEALALPLAQPSPAHGLPCLRVVDREVRVASARDEATAAGSDTALAAIPLGTYSQPAQPAAVGPAATRRAPPPGPWGRSPRSLWDRTAWRRLGPNPIPARGRDWPGGGVGGGLIWARSSRVVRFSPLGPRLRSAGPRGRARLRGPNYE